MSAQVTIDVCFAKVFVENSHAAVGRQWYGCAR